MTFKVPSEFLAWGGDDQVHFGDEKPIQEGPGLVLALGKVDVPPRPASTVVRYAEMTSSSFLKIYFLFWKFNFGIFLIKKKKKNVKSIN